MYEPRLRADDFREVSEECNNVVFDLGLDLIDPRDVEFGRLALAPDRLGGVFWNDAQFRHCIGGMRLDFKPYAKLGFRRPDGGHLGAGIAGDCHAASPRASSAALRIAAILAL